MATTEWRDVNGDWQERMLHGWKLGICEADPEDDQMAGQWRATVGKPRADLVVWEAYFPTVEEAKAAAERRAEQYLATEARSGLAEELASRCVVGLTISEEVFRKAEMGELVQLKQLLKERGLDLEEDLQARCWTVRERAGAGGSKRTR